MEDISMIAILAAAAVVGSVLIVLARRRSSARFDAIREICRANGWRLDRSTDETGHIRITRITDPDATWVLEEHFSSNSESRSTTRRTTWTDPEAAIPSGLAVMSLAMAADKAAGMEKFLGMTGNGVIERHMVKTMFGAVGDGVHDLEALSVPGAAGLMMASPDASEALVPIAFHQALANASEAMPKGAMPTILRSSEGLQLRFKDIITSDLQVAALIRLGLTLGTELKKTPA